MTNKYQSLRRDNAEYNDSFKYYNFSPAWSGNMDPFQTEQEDEIEFLKKNASIVRALAEEGRLSPLQIKLCKVLGILERGWK